MSSKYINSTVLGVIVKTTYPYGKYLTYDRVVDIVARAIEATPGGDLDEDGYTLYRYTSKTKTTNPYRTLRFQPVVPRGGWMYVSDWPRNGHTGLMSFIFDNHHIINPKQLHHDRETGMMYEVTKPEGW